MDILEPRTKPQLRVIVRDEATYKTKSFTVKDERLDMVSLLQLIKNKLVEYPDDIEGS